jgi:predicted RNA methylase
LANKKVKLGNTRVTGKEQYYTPPSTADSIIERVLDKIPDSASRSWIEPAGGTGTFIDAARRHGVQDVLSFDIEPHHPEVQLGNFLEQHLSVSDAVSIGNPPFGRNNSLSIPFFNHCAKYSDLICFIVPRSWRKWTVINRLDSSFHLVDDYDLTINYVDVEGMPLSEKSVLKTVVQTWKREEHLRNKIAVSDRGIIKRVKPDQAEVSLTIFGFSCGTVKTEFPKVPNTTQMFLTLHHPKALEALQSVDFSRFFNNTAYTEALSIQEINYLLNEYIFGDPCLEGPPSDTLF